jgi:hypothetical protein
LVLAVDSQAWAVLACLDVEMAVVHANESKPKLLAVGADGFCSNEAVSEEPGKI